MMLTRRHFLMAATAAAIAPLNAASAPITLASATPLLERFEAEPDLTRLILVLSPT